MNRHQRRAAEKQGQPPRHPAGTASPATVPPGVAELLAAGVAHHRAGRLPQAETCYRQVLAAQPDHAEALHLMGVIAQQIGRHDVAVDLIRRAIERNGNSPSYFCNLGDALRDLGRFEEAVAACRHAIRMKPDFAEAYSNLGIALKGQGKLDEAVAAGREAIRIKPEVAEAHFNLGNALRELGKVDEAIAAYRQAVRIDPGSAKAHVNLGAGLFDRGDFDEAVAAYREAIRLKPDFARAYANLGIALFEQGRIAEALACYRRALARDPSAGTLTNYGIALSNYGRHEEAVTNLKLAMAAAPDDPMPHSSLIFALNFDPAATAAEHQAERLRWNERHARRFAQWGGHDNDPDRQRRLRIGYVSRYFCSQAATYAFGGIIMCHDPDRFEIVCYSDTEQEDNVTRHLRGRADIWHDTAGLDDEACAELIRADRVDILVDLVGHMRGHRLLVFARKPAPIQVTGWGEPTGTGLTAMDYLFADPVLVPLAERGLLAEKVVDLPNFLGYWAPDPIPEPRALPALDRGYVTLGSFSRFDKIQEPVLISWARIMNALAGSRLVLKEGRAYVDSSQRERITSVLGANGIDPERVIFLGLLNRVGHFEAYHAIDLALDPFPHGGGMTTIDALWMGVPVVTFPGHTISSRLASATLSAAGLTDFIAPDLDGYVDLAVNKASDLAALARLRATLRVRVASSAFGDPARYARAVEAAYRDMWQCWCAAHSALVDTAPRELHP